jgi:hypothetical protein
VFWEGPRCFGREWDDLPFLLAAPHRPGLWPLLAVAVPTKDLEIVILICPTVRNGQDVIYLKIILRAAVLTLVIIPFQYAFPKIMRDGARVPRFDL